MTNSVLLLLSSIGLANPAHQEDVQGYFDEAAAAPLAANGTGCEQGLEAFKKTLYPVLVKEQSCRECHDNPAPGPQQGPVHSLKSDAEGSYNAVLAYMNFDNLKRSQFYLKGGNGHCKDYGVNCDTTRENLLPLLQAWYDQGQNGCSKSFKMVTQAMPIPQNLPGKDQGFATMLIPLESLGADFAGAKLELQIQQLAMPTAERSGAFRFRSPRIVGASQPIHIKGLHFLLNGQEDPKENSFHVIDSTVGMGDSPMLSIKSLIVLEEALKPATALVQGQSRQTMPNKNAMPAPSNGAYTIAVGFETIEKAAVPQCKALDAFKQKVLPVVQSRSCFYCHGGGSGSLAGAPEARKAFDMKGSDADLCSKFKERSVLDQPTLSAIIQLPLAGAHDHPVVLPFPREVMPAWTDWISAEAAAQGGGGVQGGGK